MCRIVSVCIHGHPSCMQEIHLCIENMNNMPLILQLPQLVQEIVPYTASGHVMEIPKGYKQGCIVYQLLNTANVLLVATAGGIAIIVILLSFVMYACLLFEHIDIIQRFITRDTYVAESRPRSRQQKIRDRGSQTLYKFVVSAQEYTQFRNRKSLQFSNHYTVVPRLPGP